MPAATGAVFGKHAVFTFDEVAYTNQVRKARFVPQQDVQTYRTLVPDGAQQDSDSPVWTLELEALQINITGGLADAMRDAVGTEVEVIVQQKTGTGQPTATATITVPAIPFGVEQGAWETMNLNIPVKGEPVYGTSA